MPEFRRLLDGYRRFHSEAWKEKRERWARLSEGQSPSLLVIACSDSRVDPAQIFDVDPGEIFVVRNVAALVPPFETSPGQHGVSAALEFAIQFLKVRHVVVLGHAMCGGCRVALDQSLRGAAPGEGGFVAQWIAMLDQAREPIAARLGTEGRAAEQAMEHAAVAVSLANLRSFPCVQEKEASGALKLHGSYFSISDGMLHVLDEATATFIETE
ncbi:carbonic anhydrase [Qipengyuania sediminis]|uniref:carbonic anhydrase n=1 Tax=Qipengyuania sediminis TaxID=1532023 RepID=UPI00105A11D4|nr:carbonic anhydrase [Qipengyuania sediminis]